MRIGILRYNQTDGRPWLWTSVTKAKEYVAAGSHKKISKKIIIELYSDITPPTRPERHYCTGVKIISVPLPQLNPPSLPSTLNLWYPVRDMSSYARRNFEEIWGSPVDQWIRRFGACND